MQLSELLLQHLEQQRRRKAALPHFANHTLRPWEITAVLSPSSQSPGSDMFGGRSGRGGEIGCSSSLQYRRHHDHHHRRPGQGITFGAGPLYTDAIMGQTPSAEQREQIRKASSTILREDSIQQFEEINEDYCSAFVASAAYLPPLSREDSFSIHYHCTDQAPYSNGNVTGATTTVVDADGTEQRPGMITSSSILRLPPENPSYKLVNFLKNTGPPAEHRRPSELVCEPPRRTVSAPKNALRFLRRRGNGQQFRHVPAGHERLNLRDEGGLLTEEGKSPVPKGYEQKVSPTGQNYMALQVPPWEEEQRDHIGHQAKAAPCILNPEVLESRVSVYMLDEPSICDTIDRYLDSWNNDQSTTDEDSERPAVSYQDVGSRLARRCPTPIRSAASTPPSPIPESAISRSQSFRFPDHSEDPPARSSIDSSRTLTTPQPQHVVVAPLTPRISLPDEEFPVRHPSPEKEVEIKHPLPRRMGSHPLLLKRASSIASTSYASRSLTEFPATPPPRSPLRLRKDSRNVDQVLKSRGGDRNTTPRAAPSIRSATTSEFDFGVEPIRATVTTECTGPIKRPKSREYAGGNSKRSMPYHMNDSKREERLRTRKNHPTMRRTIDSMVQAPAQTTRQRLKKMRPQLQIPDLRPPPLQTSSATSRTSSAASGRKVTQSTLVPVSPVPSQASNLSENDEEDQTGYTPISPTASAEARAFQAGMSMSPVMMVAEQVPVPKTRTLPKPSKLLIKEVSKPGKPYAPRPRSASLSRTALKRRSHSSVHGTGIHSSPRAKSPNFMVPNEEKTPPPLPSKPPTCALPNPPATGSSKANSKAKVVGDGRKPQQQYNHRLSPVPISHDVSPIESVSSKEKRLPHVVTQRQKKGPFITSAPSSSPHKHTSANSAAVSRIDARLDYLEKQNALLQAALMAVLKTNGSMNGPISGLSESNDNAKEPMAWETRVARRSAATSQHTASSSSGSALEMYMSTRRGSRHGY